LQAEARGSAAALKEVFSDPLLAGELPGDQEILELAEAAPNASAAVIKLFRAYREQAERLTDLSHLLAREGLATALSSTRLPFDEAREAFERRPNHFGGIEAEAEAFALALESGDDLLAALKAWLKHEHGIVVRVLPVTAMPNLRRRYDRHSQRLFVSERLSPPDQLREVAMEACLVRMAAAVAAELDALDLSSDEARRLARFELARYAAHALMMPYAPFQAAAVKARYDIDVLRSRFRVSFEQAASRLITLQRPAAAGVPFFLMEIDNAGNRCRRAGAPGFPQARFGGGCPKLPVHAAFGRPGEIFVEAVEMPDGSAFLCVARTLEGPQCAFPERPRQTALLIACDLAFRDEIVYGAALPSAIRAASPELAAVLTPVGPACRLCERAGCLARAEPPVTRPLGLDEMATGLSAFDFH